MSIAPERKAEVVKDYRTHDTDTGSADVQVALLTERITGLSDHLKGHRKDNHSRRGLLRLVSKRNRLLRYLSRTEHDKYVNLIGRLGLRK
jgi:small subunit ribosomal protein S15